MLTKSGVLHLKKKEDALTHLFALFVKLKRRRAELAPGSRIMKNNHLISSSSDPTPFLQNLPFHHRPSLTTPASSRSYD